MGTSGLLCTISKSIYAMTTFYPIIKFTFALTNSSKIESQAGKSKVKETVVKIINNFIVHGAPELRMWVQYYCYGCIFILLGVKSTLYSTTWARYIYFRHSSSFNLSLIHI